MEMTNIIWMEFRIFLNARPDFLFKSLSLRSWKNLQIIHFIEFKWKYSVQLIFYSDAKKSKWKINEKENLKVQTTPHGLTGHSNTLFVRFILVYLMSAEYGVRTYVIWRFGLCVRAFVCALF